MRTRTIAVAAAVLGVCSALALPAYAAQIVGTPAADSLVGTPEADTIDALGGNDRVRSLEGSDDVSGGPGNDMLDLGLGNDEANVGGGNNTVLGGPGADVMGYGGGSNTLIGGPGADSVISAGDDTVYGRGGPDQISLEQRVGAGHGPEWVAAGRGNDLVEIHNSDDERDVIRCGPGFDEVFYYTGQVDTRDRLVDCEQVGAED